MTRDVPIIFSAPMVRALLEGRKTMTRRILKPPAPYDIGDDIAVEIATGSIKPRFAPGDRLWVREAAAFIDNSQFRQPSYWQYRADTNGRDLPGDWPADEKDNPERPRWRPSIHMPRVASRITLIVTAVKIERLWDISEQDCEAEGVVFETADPPFWYVPGILPHSLTAVGIEERGDLMPRAVQSFRLLWKHIHGGQAWEDNPFVVATSFRVIKANIDAPEARITA